MTQRRHSEYGSPITALDVRTSQGALHSDGVYYGLDLRKVDTVTLGIFNGFLLLPADDSEIVELASDDPTHPTLLLEVSPSRFPQLAVPPPAGSDYWVLTVICTHTVIEVLGGQPATFDVVFDPLHPTQAITSVAGGTVIGWVFHPGNGQALTDAMLVQAPRLQINELLSLVLDSRPVNMTVHDIIRGIPNPALGSTMQMQLIYDPAGLFVSVINPSSGIFDTLPVYYQMFAAGVPFQYINFEAQLPALSTISIQAWDAAGTAMTVDPVSISPGVATWADYQVRLVNPYTSGPYDFTKGKFWTLGISFREHVPTAPMIKIRNLRITNWRLPIPDVY